MLYVNITFPPRIAMGAQRAPTWRTGVVQTASGHESTDQQWTDVRHEFDLGFAVRNATDYQEIVAHFHQVRGRAKAFPFKDILDYRVEASNGVLLDGGGSPADYQLAKRYGSGSDAYDRPIVKPVSGTVAIYRTRTGNTVDITVSCTIDHATGILSIAGGVVLPGDTLSWAGQFVVPCRYDTDKLPSLIRDRNPGADGELLVQCDGIPVVEVRLFDE